MDYETIKKLGESEAILAVRSMLLAILLIGLTGTGAELLLLNHVESLWQWVPVLLILLSFVVLGWHGVERGPVGIRAIQCTMIAFIAAGFTGFYFHYQGSVEFKLESNPSLSGWTLFWEAVRSKAPPALAPGVMIELGLIGLAYTYRHPALFLSTRTECKDKGE